MREILAYALVLTSLAPGQLHTRILVGQNVAGGPHVQAVAKIGDVNGDGLPDFVAAEVALGGGQTGVAIVSGKTGAIIRTSVTGVVANNSSSIKSVAGLGDVNGDGVPDYAVGLPAGAGPFAAGTVKVFSGATGALLYTAFGATASDYFGWSLSAIGDVNGDGVGDILVGAPQGHTLQLGIGLPGYGFAHVVSGATGAIIRTVQGAGFLDYLGTAVARLGDVDGDGIEDFAAGAPEQTVLIDTSNVYPNVGGYVRAYSGATGAVLYTASLTSLGAGYVQYSGLGYSLAAIGDVDGDGKTDLAAGAPNFGGAVVLSGASGSLIAPLVNGLAAWSYGYSVAGPGDMNGDGIPDVAVGAHDYTVYPNLLSVGRVSVFSGTGTLLATLVGPNAAGQTGIVLAGLGDQNGDGFGELAIGSWHAPGSVDGTIQVAGLAVADAYGASPATALTLGWTVAGGSMGTISVSGAPGFAPGLLAAAAAASSAVIGGMPVLVSLAPAQLLTFPFTFAGSGSLSGPLDLRQGPFAAGFTVYLQAAALSPGAPILVSNGMALTFAP